MGVFSDTAVAAGAASLPGPLTDASDDLWFVWIGLATHVEVGATALNVQPNFGTHHHFDSKAMRRVEEGFQIVAMIELNASGGAQAIIATSLYSTRSS